MVISDILLTFADVSVATLEVFDPRGYYRRDIKAYKEWRKKHNIDSKKAYYLKKRGLITNDGKNYVLTEKAKMAILRGLINNISIERPSEWDGKWRLVIFDVPEKYKTQRETSRRKLKQLEFLMIQKSVFCHPYNCLNEIGLLTRSLGIEEFVTIFESDNIITTKDYFRIFAEKGLI